MKASWVHLTLVLFLVACTKSNGPDSSVKKDSDPNSENPEYLMVTALGGDATSPDSSSTSHGFSYPIPNLSDEYLELHLEGDRNFESHFSDDPNRAEYGLGPVFNNTSCIACHNADGRGSLPINLSTNTWKKVTQNESIFLRISIESKEILDRVPTEENAYNAPLPVPGYSTQLYHLGAFQLRVDRPGVGEAELWIKTKNFDFVYPDGQRVELMKPLFEIRHPYDEIIDPESGRSKSRLWESDVRFSPRIGMPMFGLGLLEAIKDSDIEALAKRDLSVEGVSGKVNYVYDVEKSKNEIFPARSLGRFGLKANTPSVRHQALGALQGDIGVTNSWFPFESIFKTVLYKQFLERVPYYKPLEASDEVSDSLVFYSRTLAVPPRRNVDSPDVIMGAKIFKSVRCTSCHTPSYTTGPSDVLSLSHQKIYPFTDMLLHDMGEGLADGRQDFLANGREWKTRALWGIGLTQVVNPRAGYLHDGRARTLEEAVLWHGGEASYSLNQFIHLNRTQRRQLIEFLKSL